jgi:hypothetical protein
MPIPARNPVAGAEAFRRIKKRDNGPFRGILPDSLPFSVIECCGKGKAKKRKKHMQVILQKIHQLTGG